MDTLRKIAWALYLQVPLLAVSGTSIADQPCPPNITSDPYRNVIVNGPCEVYADVTGNITVWGGGILNITGRKVTESIEVDQGGRIDLRSIEVRGYVRGLGADDFRINGRLIGQGVRAENGRLVSIMDTQVRGNVILYDNVYAEISNTTIGGNLYCRGNVDDTGQPINKRCQ